MTKLWKKGRGKLGVFAPLFGEWVAQADSDRERCTAGTLQPILAGRYVPLTAHWEYGAIDKRQEYDELALIKLARMVS